MNDTEKEFLSESALKTKDLKHRKTINFNMGKYHAAVPNGKKQFIDDQQIRRLAKNRKWLAIENLDQSLTQFEKQFTKISLKRCDDLDQTKSCAGKRGY